MGDGAELIGHVNEHGGDISFFPMLLTDHGQESFAGYGRGR